MDIATVIPTFLARYVFKEKVDYNQITNFVDFLNFCSYFFQTIRILRVLRVHRHLEIVEDNVQRFLGQLAISFITMLLYGTILVVRLQFVLNL